jgi:hypothetical protein
MWRILTLFVCGCFPAATVVQAQATYPRQSLTAGVGGIFPVSGWVSGSFTDGPALNVEYGYRFWRYAQAEAGYSGAWPKQLIFTGHDSFIERQNLTFLSYGGRGILPLHGDRLLLSAGAGGGYLWDHQTFSSATTSLFQYSGRASYAIDSKQRYRFGATVRVWQSLGEEPQRWLTLTGDFTYSF